MGELYHKACSLPVLMDAWKMVKGKGAAGGLDRVSVDDFHKDLGRNMDRLVADLQAGRYAPEPLERINAPKHDGTRETRPLSLPSVRDKLVQQAVRLVIEPLFNPRFLDCSYAYRPGKGPRKAFGRINHYLTTEKKTWIALGDFDRFFDTLDQDILLREVGRVVHDPEIIGLIRMWMTIGYVGSSGDYFDTEGGVGQGSVISPLLSNIYAHPLDDYMIRQGYAYLRYSDNLIILALSKKEATSGLDDLAAFAKDSLKLTLNAYSRPVRSLTEGFVFLGVFYQGESRAISTGKMGKIRRRLKGLITPGKDPDKLILKICQSLEGTARYYGVIQTESQFAEIDQFVVNRLAPVLAEYVQRGVFRNTSQLTTYLMPLPFLSEGFKLRKEATLKELAGLVIKKTVSAKARTEAKAAAPAPVQKAVQRADRAVSRRKQRYVRDRGTASELVVSTHGAVLGKASGRLVVKCKGKILATAQFDKLKNVVVATSGVSLSSDLIRECTEKQIGIHFAEAHGPPYAMIHAPAHPRASLCMAQMRAIQDGKGFDIARIIVKGKIRNQLNLLKFYGRSRADEPAYQEVLDSMEQEVDRLYDEADGLEVGEDYALARERLFSIEGRAASSYWGLVRKVMGDDVPFPGRRRRGATDLVNSLLNYGYAMIYPRVWRAVVLAGLNPHLSFLHAPDDKEPSLTFDLIEEFRCQAVDRAVITMISRNEPVAVDPKGLLTEDTKRLLVSNVLERLTALMPTRKGRMPLDEVIRQQPRRLAQALTEDRPYRPFVGRY
jgi:group II intron reverse transcriptase/maturase/CRISPR-associated endonuclease Cas1